MKYYQKQDGRYYVARVLGYTCGNWGKLKVKVKEFAEELNINEDDVYVYEILNSGYYRNMDCLRIVADTQPPDTYTQVENLSEWLTR